MRGMSGHRIATATLGLAVASFLAAPAVADDAEIRSRIEQRFAKAGLDQDTDIEVRVVDSVVYLEGIALSLHGSREAERLARKVAKTVINEIRVLPERTRSDRKIKEDAENAVHSYAQYGVFDAVSLDVDSGLVSIHGFVLNSTRRRGLEDRLARIEGVRDVHNDLRLQGPSLHDERLRRQLYTRIYSDPLFARYASWAEPPVRIFVDRGQVTLAGTVASKAEQAALGFMARESLAFSVKNLVQVESAVPEEDSPRNEG